MRIETDRGAVVEASTVTTARMRGESRLLIVIGEDSDMAGAAQIFDGAQRLTVTREETPGAAEIYEGYGQIVSMSRDERGALRLTLRYGGAA